MESLTTWLTGREAQQADLQGHEDPVLHSSEVNSKVGEVGPLSWSCLALEVWCLAEDLDTEIIRPNGGSSVEQGVLSYSAAVQGTAALCRSTLSPARSGSVKSCEEGCSARAHSFIQSFHLDLF